MADETTESGEQAQAHQPLRDLAASLRGGPKLTTEPTPRRARALLRLDTMRATRKEHLERIAANRQAEAERSKAEHEASVQRAKEGQLNARLSRARRERMEKDML